MFQEVKISPIFLWFQCDWVALKLIMVDGRSYLSKSNLINHFAIWKKSPRGFPRSAPETKRGQTAGRTYGRTFEMTPIPCPNFVQQNIAAQHIYIDKLGVSKYKKVGSSDISSANSKILQNVAFARCCSTPILKLKKRPFIRLNAFKNILLPNCWTMSSHNTDILHKLLSSHRATALKISQCSYVWSNFRS